MFQKMYFIS